MLSIQNIKQNKSVFLPWTTCKSHIQDHVSRLEYFETGAHPQETTCPQILRQKWYVLYPVIHVSEGSINGEFGGEMRLNWALLLFLSTHYTTEEYTYALVGSGCDTFRWCRSGSGCESVGELVCKRDESRTSLIGGRLRISAVHNQIVYLGGRTASSDQILQAQRVNNVAKTDLSLPRKITNEP